MVHKCVQNSYPICGLHLTTQAQKLILQIEILEMPPKNTYSTLYAKFVRYDYIVSCTLCMDMHACMCVCVYICVCSMACTCVHACMCGYFACVCIVWLVHACMCGYFACMHVCVYIYMCAQYGLYAHIPTYIKDMCLVGCIRCEQRGVYISARVERGVYMGARVG